MRLVDTAGIRETLDFVEKIGVEKTKSCLEDADIILLVVDATQGITREEQELIDKHGEKKLLLIVNKIDLQKTSINIQSNIPMSMVSALTRDGMDALEEEIFNMILSGDFAQPDDVLVSNVRHQIVMEKAKEHLQHFVDALQHGLTPDLTSLELRCAWEAVGEITGESITENLLDRIFSDFCIGK